MSPLFRGSPELILTRKEFISQNDTLRIQRFENTFFKLLNLLRSNAETVSFFNISKIAFEDGDYILSHSKDIVHGSTAFKCIDQKIQEAETHLDNLDNLTLFYRSLYITFLQEHFYKFISTFFRLLTLINDTKFIDKEQYIKIIRSQLSIEETDFLAIDFCLNTKRSRISVLANENRFFDYGYNGLSKKYPMLVKKYTGKIFSSQINETDYFNKNSSILSN